MQSGRVAPVDNSRKEERKRGGEGKGREGGEERGKGGRRKEEKRKEEKRKEKSLDHGVKGLRAAYFMRLRRTY